TLALSSGAILTKSAFASIAAFAPATLEPYRSIVTTRAPVESRPPSTYQLAWEGRYYQLWQRPAEPATRILDFVPLGDVNERPYCGDATTGAPRQLCSISPTRVPKCSQVESLARFASGKGAQLVAYQRPEPVVVRGDRGVWTPGWEHSVEGANLIPNRPGQMVSHIGVASSQRYELWLGGNCYRGSDVSVDGRHVGRVRNQLTNIGQYVPVASFFLEAGVHTITLTYPHASLAPGSGDNSFTVLTAIALEPLESPPSELLTVS